MTFLNNYRYLHTKRAVGVIIMKPDVQSEIYINKDYFF